MPFAGILRAFREIVSVSVGIMTLFSSNSPPSEMGDPGGSRAGMAGMDRETAALRWAEECRHALKTPGAYEWWYFEAIDAAGDGIILTLFEGLPFHPNYLSRISRHAHRAGASPFDRMGPELLASHYPAAYIAVYQGGKRVAQSLNIFPPDSAEGNSEIPDVRIGPNRMTLRQDGTFGIRARGYTYEVLRAQPRPRRDVVINATLTFAPTFPGVAHTRAFRPNGPDGAQHTWVITAPHGRLTGNVQVIDHSEGVCKVDLHLHTLAYHDHVYGHGGLGLGVTKTLWGFLQGENWAAVWNQNIVPGESLDHADGLVIFEKGSAPVVVEGPSSRLENTRLTNWLMGHPTRVQIHGSSGQGHPVELQVANDMLMDTTPFHTRLKATGTLNIPGYRNYTGRGSTHVWKLRRLKWPVLSDIVLMAIMPVSEDDPLWRE